MKKLIRLAICTSFVVSVGLMVYTVRQQATILLLSAVDPPAPPRGPDHVHLSRAGPGIARANSSFPAEEDFTFDVADMTDERGNPYTIVIWLDRGGKPGYVANPDVCLGNVTCVVTYDTSRKADAHAIVFNRESRHDVSVASERKAWQLYAWWEQESPLHSSGPADVADYFYNVTFHYRRDAGVYAPYGSTNLILRELLLAGDTDVDELLAAKKKMAAWAVSNCYGRRIDFARSLMSAGLDVDTFGGCFGNRQIGAGRYSDSFYRELRQYKFYLAFENSIHCKDYITEKFWFNGLRSGAVPVVWGPAKEDVLAVAPSNSFVHADDFSSPRALVDYLQYLARNESAYRRYLEWRTWAQHPERVEPRLRRENVAQDLRSFCKLCAILQQDGRRRKAGKASIPRLVKSARATWAAPERGKCHK